MASVYLVVAGSVCEPQALIPLGAFFSESGAQKFIDHAPPSQRYFLGIQRWEINKPTLDPFWAAKEIGATTGGRALFLDRNADHDLDPAFSRFLQKLLPEDGEGRR